MGNLMGNGEEMGN